MNREGAAKREADARAAVLRLALRACDSSRHLTQQRLRAEGVRLGSVGAQRTGPLGADPPCCCAYMAVWVWVCVCACVPMCMSVEGAVC